ncbi:MAG TPA: hypothetical protein VLN45_00900 [Ignavibacteriaceae bacterium]|nr:hypothetical protein [Ignavibacteriaceae bacterium]
MKKLTKYFLVLITSVLITSCEINDPDDFHNDYNPPIEPSGIVVINGDYRVDLYWDENRENDLAGYNVYYSSEYDGRYELIGSTETNYFIDRDVENGVTYFYAVTAYDYNGNESELSFDVVYATPRPEGFNQSIFDYHRFPENSGYAFSEFQVVEFDDLESDLFFELFEGEYYLNVWDDSDIQDMGETYDIYDIPFAPTSGWNPNKYEVAEIGHTYVIWTWDNHFAKIRVKSITNDRIVFDWAYQLVEGENQLKPKVKGSVREPLTGKKKIQNNVNQ